MHDECQDEKPRQRQCINNILQDTAQHSTTPHNTAQL
jgi:hypothetical protein